MLSTLDRLWLWKRKHLPPKKIFWELIQISDEQTLAEARGSLMQDLDCGAQKSAASASPTLASTMRIAEKAFILTQSRYSCN
jgi:hypothetical protein